LEYDIFGSEKKNTRLQQNGTHHPLVYADDVKLLAKNTSSKMKKTLVVASREVGSEVSTVRPAIHGTG